MYIYIYIITLVVARPLVLHPTPPLRTFFIFTCSVRKRCLAAHLFGGGSGVVIVAHICCLLKQPVSGCPPARSPPISLVVVVVTNAKPCSVISKRFSRPGVQSRSTHPHILSVCCNSRVFNESMCACMCHWWLLWRLAPFHVSSNAMRSPYIFAVWSTSTFRFLCVPPIMLFTLLHVSKCI